MVPQVTRLLISQQRIESDPASDFQPRRGEDTEARWTGGRAKYSPCLFLRKWHIIPDIA